ncbi:MAG: NDP-sugar synthase [Acidimicrobiia bacterium]|nr:NDP-sugar synthase [Acidimicrobiia bacterium]
MQAVVLVGGFGTRLRPLTDSIPKPMLPVGHVPMIERLVRRLARGGVTEVVLALGFKPEPFIEAFPDDRCGDVTLRYAVEPEPLDTAGAIRFAADAVGIGDTFVVANGDVITDLDVGRLVDTHRSLGAEATLHLIAVDDPSAFGVVDIDDSGTIRAFVEKPPPGTEPGNLINAGTYVFEPSVLDRITLGQPSSIERETFPAIADSAGLYGHPTDDYWIDAGRPDLYRAANLDLLGPTRRSERCNPVAESAVVDPSAVVVNSIVGDRAAVGRDARIVDSVLLPGAAVGTGSSVSASLVMGVVGDGATVCDTLIGATGRVASGALLEHAALPDPAVSST